MRPRGLIVEDDMNRAYQLLPNVLIVISYAVKKRQFLPWIFAAVGFFYLLSLGTRGPLLIVFAFLISDIFLSKYVKKHIKIAFAIFAILIVFIFLIPSVYQIVLPPINTLLKRIGLSTRVFDSFLYEKVSSTFDSGRSELYSFAVDKILEKPFLGYGVYGEWEWIGWNVHNVFLEIFILDRMF